MKKRYALAAAVATCIVALAPLSAHANTLTDILDFNPYNSGSNPVGAFAVGPLSGNLGFNILYGVTATGGGYGYGATFMLTPPQSTGQTIWTETILTAFNGTTSGSTPQSGLVSDANGVLYGTASSGGTAQCTQQPYGPATPYKCGIVYSLTRNSNGIWQSNILYAFQGFYNHLNDGWGPVSSLLVDANGNLYGTTTQGGAANQGAVFELVRQTNGTYIESRLYDFQPVTGNDPIGALIGDGNPVPNALYGTTSGLDPGNPNGAVFRLTRNMIGVTWQYATLYQFGPEDPIGINPVGLHLAEDGSSGLVGVTEFGAHANCGAVFTLEPPPGGSGYWVGRTLYNFTGAPNDGCHPTGVFFNFNNIFGTTAAGGSANKGILYRLDPAQNGGRVETVLHSFTGAPHDGAQPNGGLAIGSSGGMLYGTTYSGGASNLGQAFWVNLP